MLSQNKNHLVRFGARLRPAAVLRLALLFSMGAGLLFQSVPTTPVAYAAACISTADCLSKMTLDEKIGQMTQAHKDALTTDADIATYFLGSLLSGGGEGPSGSGGTATQWAD